MLSFSCRRFRLAPFLQLAAALCALLGGVAAAQASELLAVYTKQGVEVIVKLEDPSDFHSFAGLARGQLPPQFGGTVDGASLAIVGSFDVDATVVVGGKVQPRPNLLFSGRQDPHALGAEQIAAAFELLTSGEASFLRRYRDLPPGTWTHVSQADPASFFSSAGGETLGGLLPSTAVTLRRGAHLRLAVFGAAAPVQTELGGPPGESNVALALAVGDDGSLRPVTVKSLRFSRGSSQTFALFTKNGLQLIVNLGPLEELSVSPPFHLGKFVPDGFGPGGLEGSQVSLLGFFDADSRRPNLFFSDGRSVARWRVGPPRLTAMAISQAFAKAYDYLLEDLPNIAVGDAIVRRVRPKLPPCNFGDCAEPGPIRLPPIVVGPPRVRMVGSYPAIDLPPGPTALGGERAAGAASASAAAQGTSSRSSEDPPCDPDLGTVDHCIGLPEPDRGPIRRAVFGATTGPSRARAPAASAGPVNTVAVGAVTVDAAGETIGVSLK